MQVRKGPSKRDPENRLTPKISRVSVWADFISAQSHSQPHSVCWYHFLNIHTTLSLIHSLEGFSRLSPKPSEPPEPASLPKTSNVKRTAPFMSKVPDAWEDEWSNVVDEPASSSHTEQSKKVSSKVSKAQKRAQQAEFNRQIWAEAEGPKQTNYFLESRNVVPHRQEYKPPPILLSRKGPIVQSSRRPPADDFASLNIKNESSEDEDELKARELSLAERQAQAAKEREEKQRKYEERRLELFGPKSNGSANANPPSKSGNSSPGSGTPPQSRSSTPSRGGRRGRGRGNHTPMNNGQPRVQSTVNTKELFDAIYPAKLESSYLQRREQGSTTPRQAEIQPIRTPRGPDGTAGFDFGSRARLTEKLSSAPPVQFS